MMLSNDEVVHFHRLKERALRDGKPMVLWGWKRDKIAGGAHAPESRTVYFSADLSEEGGKVGIERAFFFLETRAKREEIEVLEKHVGAKRSISRYQMDVSTSDTPSYSGYAKLRMRVGEPSRYDLATIERRRKGKPRISIPSPRLVAECGNYDLSSFAPFVLCVGSGLSSESGLPLLGEIHNLFEVDNMATGELVFGASDTLPARIVANVDWEFASFCQFTIDAVKAEPSDSHRMIADLYQKGIVRQVFTDNMDDIFKKVNVPYTRTRLSIFPDRFPVAFDSGVKSLLVIGVAVDRRDVIKQGRAAGLNIIAINPVFGVAPHSRNMDYLCRGDIFFRQRAREALPKIAEASGFGGSRVSLLFRERVLVTGANGFIGMNTVRTLKETKEVRNFNGDVREISDWQKNLEGGEIIFLIAGVRTETDTDFSVNAKSIENLFYAAVRVNKLPKKIIVASSQAVYMGNDIPFKESQKPIPTTVYGKSKLLAEEIAEGFCRDLNIPLVILRYSTVLGKGIREHSGMSGPLVVWTNAALASKPITIFQDGGQTRDYIHIDDVVSANLMAVNVLEAGIYNVGGGKAIKLLELARWITESSASKSEIIILGGTARHNDPRDMFSDTTRLRKYGWKPKRSAREAVREFVASRIRRENP